MNVLDLFAGAGGLSEGFRQEGYNVVAHVEMDSNAALTLKTREAYYYLKSQNQISIYEEYLLKKITREELYSNIPGGILEKVINDEISDDSIENIFNTIDNLIDKEKVDMVIGGPPCQAYSVAGRSRDPLRMENDPRNYLYKQYIKFLDRYKPKYFVFENVMGILSAKGGEILEDIQNEMTKAGYKMEYQVLNSKDFGVLQSRKRVIIIGWKTNITFEFPEFTQEITIETIKNLFSDLPAIKAGEKKEPGYFYKTRIVIDPYLVKSNIRSKEWRILSQHEARPHRETDLEIYRYCVKKWNDEGRKVKYDELPNRLQTHKNTDTFLDRFNIVNFNGISHTIVAHISKDGHYYIHPDIDQNRSITVREAARIQSFPDDYFFESSRTAAFKQIGNAVPPLMARKIAMKFKSTDT
ncbi:DNA cytosine methyltransferase [Peribacillus frigoritolerans]|uniref:DNA cytosine methyltransferase n=1 Tax=Peribacillus frigoritolerans TaxID=450367 RepID=UPI0038129F77